MITVIMHVWSCIFRFPVPRICLCSIAVMSLSCWWYTFMRLVFRTTYCTCADSFILEIVSHPLITLLSYYACLKTFARWRMSPQAYQESKVCHLLNRADLKLSFCYFWPEHFPFSVRSVCLITKRPVLIGLRIDCSVSLSTDGCLLRAFVETLH